MTGAYCTDESDVRIDVGGRWRVFISDELYEKMLFYQHDKARVIVLNKIWQHELELQAEMLRMEAMELRTSTWAERAICTWVERAISWLLQKAKIEAKELELQRLRLQAGLDPLDATELRNRLAARLAD